MKYIDAEKLITIIEERKAQQDQWINRYHDPINQEISHELTEILSIVDSLQHEQPESICPRCAYHNKTDDFCEYPYGGRKCSINENGVYECNGFEVVEQQEQPETDLLEEAYMRGFAQGAEKEWEQMEDEHGKELLYVCQKTAEREHRSGVREGKAQAEKDLTPLINRLCEAILFEWKDAADLARKTLTQIKTREE